MDAGDLATWVGSTFAAIAAGATLWTLKSQRDQIAEQRAFISEQSATLELERAELRALAAERRSRQAKRIAMRPQLGGSRGPRNALDIELEGYDRWHVDIANRSDEPIRDVLVRFGDAYNAGVAVILEAAEMPESGRRVVPVHIVGAGHTARFQSPPWGSQVTVDNNRPVVTFTDAAGSRWILDEHGELRGAPGA
ncbi:hypothetical protein [Streptomyces canus]|uniref:hypothetical protein n=1 Tax=Streptomyces canus TaxID=58343 RepID=UPI002E27BC33|nr:hypothetical protein [Streptomyces canus]